MDSLSMNTLRAILVGCAVLAIIVLLIFRYFLAAGILSVGVLFHAALWLSMWSRTSSGGQGDTPDPTVDADTRA